MLKAIGSKKDLTKLQYYSYVIDVIESLPVQRLKFYQHHIMTTRFQHCLNVSYYNYCLCRFLHFDAVSAARAGLLHDLYFYNTNEYYENNNVRDHLANHSELALENAECYFDLNEVEKDIIYSHMWPVTNKRPHSKEGYIIVIVDKYCAALEYFLPKFRNFFGLKTRVQ